MVSKRSPKDDLLTAQAPAQVPPLDVLAAVEPTDDLVDYMLRCVLALAPDLNAAVVRAAEVQVRGTFGGSRVYVGRRSGEGTAARNEAIRRDHAAGERMGLLVRRYGLSQQHLWRIIQGLSSGH